MDKNFNDQELSDIMKEIESLEEGFKADAISQSPVVEELAQMEPEKSVPPTNKHEAEVYHMKASHQEPHAFESRPVPQSSTSMSFKVHGQLNLELQFDVGGKVVCLEVTESGLTIQMDGGMTFTLPMHEKKVA